MQNVKLATLKRACVLLDAIGAKYAIVTEDGTKHGELEIVDKPQRKYPFGELTQYIRDNFQELNIGQVNVLPIGKFDRHEVQKSLVSYLCRTYGAGTHTTCSSKDKKSLEVLRIA